MKDFINIINQHNEHAIVADCINEQEILDFESFYHIKLPSDYREFIRAFGFLSIESFEIFGLGCPDTGVPNISFVLRALNEDGFAMPKGALPISFDGEQYLSLVVDSSMSNYAAIIDEDGYVRYSDFDEFVRFIMSALNESL